MVFLSCLVAGEAIHDPKYRQHKASLFRETLPLFAVCESLCDAAEGLVAEAVLFRAVQAVHDRVVKAIDKRLGRVR